ncbi:hypothetical protein PISMIDRAFT_24510 [Pisolithus microcarpus 441]|uniref:Uncharacterized protein n=1 Tax=Pisolithus microcarpus 441 TaxID=765257 RepID=A0A0C9ZGG4_9AGAM|nr:hypothetical protein PISMIDRAFT_24510 [Pisolithus microcarpus 441]
MSQELWLFHQSSPIDKDGVTRIIISHIPTVAAVRKDVTPLILQRFTPLVPSVSHADGSSHHSECEASAPQVEDNTATRNPGGVSPWKLYKFRDTTGAFHWFKSEGNDPLSFPPSHVENVAEGDIFLYWVKSDRVLLYGLQQVPILREYNFVPKTRLHAEACSHQLRCTDNEELLIVLAYGAPSSVQNATELSNTSCAWDLQNRTPIWQIEANPTSPQMLLAIKGMHADICIYNLGKSHHSSRFTLPHEPDWCYPTSLAFVLGNALVCGTNSGKVVIWAPGNKEVMQVLDQKGDIIQAVVLLGPPRKGMQCIFLSGGWHLSMCQLLFMFFSILVLFLATGVNHGLLNDSLRTGLSSLGWCIVKILNVMIVVLEEMVLGLSHITQEGKDGRGKGDHNPSQKHGGDTVNKHGR